MSKTFKLFFDVSATHISMAEYDDVAVEALVQENNGFGRQFSITDYWETELTLNCKIIYKNTIVDKLGNFQLAEIHIEVEDDEYDYLDENRTIDNMIKALKNRLIHISSKYQYSYDETDRTEIYLDKIEIL